VDREQVEEEHLAAERAMNERLFAPIAPACEVDRLTIGVDQEQVEIQVLPGHDQYLQRDIDKDLRQALDETLAGGKPRLIMLHGPPKAGKSRTLLEAVLRHPNLRTATLIAPKRDAGALSWLLEPGHMPSFRPGPAVLWLDDLEYFVHPSGMKGMNPDVLISLDKWERHVVVLATAGGKGAALLTDSNLSTPFNELLRSVRPLLLLSSDLSEDELSRARASYGVDQAEPMEKHGIGEFLVAAPELAHKLATERHPGDTETCPEGAAVVWAAADWARSGMLRPVPEKLLRSLWRNYPGGTHGTFQNGLGWALRTIYRSSSLLLKEGGGYRPYESIVAYANRQRNINSATWDSIIELATPEEAFQLGVAAYNVGTLDRAERAMQKSGDAKNPEVAGQALFNLGVLAEERGDLEGAEAAYRRADERGHADAAFALGVLLQQRGDLEGAEAAYRRADERGHVTASFALGVLLQQRGDLQGAEAAYRRAEKHGHLQATLLRGALLHQRGDLQGAEDAYRRASEGGFGEAATSLGALLRHRGDLEGAKAAYQRADELTHLRNTTQLGGFEVVSLPGALELDAFVITNGDNPAYDDGVRDLVTRANLLALGDPGDAPETAHLLHCTVPVAESTIEMLPVFTRLEYVVGAVQMNPSWSSLIVVIMQGSVLMGDLEEGEWLGINPWSGHEFKLPAGGKTPPSVALDVDPDSRGEYLPDVGLNFLPRRLRLTSRAFKTNLKGLDSGPSL
jgi:tetratricopeptide (TPR) repeat protein